MPKKSPKTVTSLEAAALPEIAIEASRKRLFWLSLFAAFCFAGGLLNLAPALAAGTMVTFWPLAFMLFCALFLLWSLAAGWTALMQPKIAYRLNDTGLFIGDQSVPAFTWGQVRGATLVRGKRRSAVAVILEDPQALNTAGLMPAWRATFLGRPTDRDIPLTNMDTNLGLEEFLDLIGPYFHTYGPQSISER